MEINHEVQIQKPREVKVAVMHFDSLLKAYARTNKMPGNVKNKKAITKTTKYFTWSFIYYKHCVLSRNSHAHSIIWVKIFLSCDT